MAPVARTFRAMNSDMRILLYPATRVTGAEGRAAVAEAERMVRAYEARFSRFLPDSELSQLNQASGTWTSVSPEMAEVLKAAGELHRASEGLFDPAILPQLELAGYDWSFEDIPPDRSAWPRPRPSSSSTFAALEFAGSSLVRLPLGCRLDLGGIVKGWSADRVASWLAGYGAVLVDLGGDIALGGRPPGGRWRVGVERPGLTGELLTMLGVESGGVATSGTTRRRWQLNGRPMHHLIDPRTGQPACSDLVQVVAVDSAAFRAEVWAKVALLAGSEGSRHLLAAQPGLRLLLVSPDGSAVVSPGLEVLDDGGWQAA